MTTLYVRDGDEFREASAQAVLDRAHALIAQRFRRGTPALTSAARPRGFLRLKLGALGDEAFCVLFLTQRHRLLGYVDLLPGPIPAPFVPPRGILPGARHCWIVHMRSLHSVSVAESPR